MKLIEIRETLEKLNLPALTLQDVIGTFHFDKTHASHIMERLVKAGSLLKIKRGLWAWPNSDPLVISTYLTASFPSYVSLQSALFYHGVIEQIPLCCYVVTLGRKQKIDTPIGGFSIHHITPHFFMGFATHYHPFYQIASPEKALLDYFYLGKIEPRLFGKLPEIESSGLSFSSMKKLIEHLKNPTIQAYLFEKIKEIF